MMANRDERGDADDDTAPPPPIASPLEPGDGDDEVERIAVTMLGHEHGSEAYTAGADRLRLHTLRPILERWTLEHEFTLAWPRGLYIPSGADQRRWPWLGTAQRYSKAWTTGGAGWAQASHDDGSLHAVASSPTAKGAIDGQREAGVGFELVATDSLAQVRLTPDLRFVGRHQWNVAPPPTVWTSTRVIGTLFVGAFQLDPVSGRWEVIRTSPWRRLVVFDRSHQGSGAAAPESMPFEASGPGATVNVLVEGGRRYLFAVIAQVAIRITTTDSHGRHVNVTSGRFDTWGSLTGVVSEMRIDTSVYVP